MWPHCGALARRCAEIHHASVKLNQSFEELSHTFQTTGKTKKWDPLPRRDISPHGVSELSIKMNFFGSKKQLSPKKTSPRGRRGSSIGEYDETQDVKGTAQGVSTD